ncbi:MAG: DNA-binding protein [Burkholderiaceae bacterium]|nr:MAG: DNA-binding protein [Burkholderiaceae bacterium]
MRSFTSERLAVARASFKEQGTTVSDFCAEHSLSYNVVINVLHGRSEATRGESHRAAVLLGLKPVPSRQKRKSTSTGVGAQPV